MAAADNKKSGQALDDLYLDAFDEDKEPVTTNADDSLDDLAGLAPPAAEPGAPESYDLAVGDETAAMDGWDYKGLRAAGDHLSVTFWSKGGGPITVEELTAGLERLGIVHGVDHDALQLIADLSREPGWEGEVVVARGTPPEVGRAVRDCIVRREQGPAGDQRLIVDGAELDFGTLAEVFTAEEMIELRDSPLVVKAVRPGTRLIEIDLNPEAQPGRDVFGTEIPVIEEPLPVSGRHVRYNEKEQCYEAMLHGYLLIMGGIISIQPPVWIQPDQLAAYFINFSQVGRPCFPSAKDLYNDLIFMGVHKRCISPERLKKAARLLATGKAPKVIKLAKAIKPITGRDAEFDLQFDTEQKAGTEREDGSIDLRERNTVTSVKEGQLLAVKTAATRGVSGLTLLGKLIKAPNGRDVKINCGAGIRQVKKEGKIFYFASRDGNVHFTRNTLMVVDVMQIKGDVDYETGNLNVNSDLEIGGSVLPGFSVRAKGSVYINGAVENGATVVAGGELMVVKGIMGENTRVACMGDLQTGFIQDAEVLAKGNVVINSYLYNARLRAAGKVTVLKGQGRRSGRIVGGVCCASRAIRTCYAGSPSSSGTVLSIQPDPELGGRLKAVDSELEACTRKLSRISRTLPFDNFEPERVRAYIESVPAAQRQGVMRLLASFSKMIKQQKELRARREKLAERAEFALRHGVIRISHTIHQGCEIEFGKARLLVQNDHDAAAFIYKKGKIVFRGGEK